MENKKTFGTFICQRRKELGLTQKEFAQRLFVTDSAVSKWERGLAYPDITLLQSICQVLQCSEKELLSASEDTEGHRVEQLAKKHLRLTRNYRLAQYILFGLIALGCLIGNLAGDHALTWFWIVLASEVLCASLTLLPTFLPDRWRWPGTLGGFVASLLLLLLVCCLFDQGHWFPVAAAGVLFGFGLVFLPWVLRVLPLPESLTRRKSLVYVTTELVLLLLLYGACRLDAGGTWLVSACLWTVFGVGLCLLPFLMKQVPLPQPLQNHKALVYLGFETLLLLVGVLWESRGGVTEVPSPLAVTLLCLTLPWGWLGALRYLPLDRWFRASAALAWTGLWVWLFPWGLDRMLLAAGWVSSNPYRLALAVDFTDWVSPNTVSANVMLLIILGFLLLGLVCAAIGISRRRNPRP